MSFGTLIVAHLIGDYLLQPDWMASRKAHVSSVAASHVLLHVGVTALMVYADVGHPWPLWALSTLGVTHFVIDRFRLAPKLMRITGQRGFLENLGPWSMIIVDNTLHLVILWVLWLFTR